MEYVCNVNMNTYKHLINWHDMSVTIYENIITSLSEMAHSM